MRREANGGRRFRTARRPRSRAPILLLFHVARRAHPLRSIAQGRRGGRGAAEEARAAGSPEGSPGERRTHLPHAPLSGGSCERARAASGHVRARCRRRRRRTLPPRPPATRARGGRSSRRGAAARSRSACACGRDGQPQSQQAATRGNEQGPRRRVRGYRAQFNRWCGKGSFVSSVPPRLARVAALATRTPGAQRSGAASSRSRSSRAAERRAATEWRARARRA